MRLTVNRIVEVTLKYWEEMDKDNKKILIRWDAQTHMMQRFIEGFVEGYIEERKEYLSEQEIIDLDKYKYEAKQILAKVNI